MMLTAEDEAIQAGRRGEVGRRALEMQVATGEFFGAGRMVRVTTWTLSSTARSATPRRLSGRAWASTWPATEGQKFWRTSPVPFSNLRLLGQGAENNAEKNIDRSVPDGLFYPYGKNSHSGKNMPTENEVVTNLRRRLPELLPTLRVAVERPTRDAPWDLVLKVQSAGKTRRLLCEVKSVGEPRYLAQAITSLTLAARKDPRIYPVVVAPYISPEGQRLCREAGVGYLDLTGNVFLRFDGILVDRLSGQPPPRGKARLRRLFAPKSSRIVRVLLEQPGTEWTLAGLAEEAAISLRTAHLVVNALEEKAFVEKRRGAIRLQKPGDLLDLWAQNYSLERHLQHIFYTFVRNPSQLAAKLTAHALSHREAVGLTLHSGAAFVAPFVRSPDVYAYFVGDRERLVKSLDLRPVESGGTVHLLEPYDEGVFYRVQTIRGVRVVCNTQLYLDLINYPARGREQAEVIRRRKLGY